ncbi:Trimethylguanosine synthase [Gaertneriomyces sp. JEL0708]|nr:Trimethylguanosine synthase [Gaertneriomyces sp. JEL0708]
MGCSKKSPRKRAHESEEEAIQAMTGEALEEHSHKKRKAVELDDELFLWTEDIIPNKLKKYWIARYTLFSQFDTGVLLDEESWFSVTPEKLAAYHARRLACSVVIDAFCGAGGNSIQFAKTCGKVIAVDIDPIKLRCAKRNAELYNVANSIEFICGDFLQLAPSLRKYNPEAVFLSPPWGGPNYTSAKTFDIHKNLPLSMSALFKAAKGLSDNIMLFMPRNSDIDQLTKLAGPGGVCEIESQHLNDRCKALGVYFGNLVNYESDVLNEEAPEQYDPSMYD